MEELGVLAEKTLVNARELLNEAKALGLLQHYPRAFSLAVLAAEEYGKHLMCFGAVGLRSDDNEMWKDFHQRFRTHTPKYENLFAMAASLLPEEDRAEFMRDLSKHIRADQERKLAGFYVDLVRGNAIHPEEVIGADLVRDAIVVYDRVIGLWEHLWADTDFSELFAEGVARGAEELRYALIEGDAETVKRYFAAEEGEEE
ncbi:hypothetical protein BMS3Bbin01_01681 [bacterium BMS3Bbin01]|nr:hypothetical protein BMS3Bbin01_01681 [bacterium BMS3Bbin01]